MQSVRSFVASPEWAAVYEANAGHLASGSIGPNSQFTLPDVAAGLAEIDSGQLDGQIAAVPALTGDIAVAATVHFDDATGVLLGDVRWPSAAQRTSRALLSSRSRS